MWPSGLEVLENVFDDDTEGESSAHVRGVLQKMQSYEFVFPMMLMNKLLGITYKLSMALQENDQNILNAINHIRTVKDDLQNVRESGWDGLVKEVEKFCQANEIPIIDMEDIVPRSILVKRDGKTITNQLPNVEDLEILAKKMKETMKDRIFPLLYRLVELVLLLPVATASVERVFSVMKTVKTKLKNIMGDEWLNDNLVVLIEREIFATIDNEPILNCFQNMDSRRNQLSRAINRSVA